MLEIITRAIDIKLCYHTKKPYYPSIATKRVSTIIFSHLPICLFLDNAQFSKLRCPYYR